MSYPFIVPPPAMQFHSPCTMPYPNSHPRPRFCIFRPGGILVPLIPVDELPAWLEVCNLGAQMHLGVQPVSLTYIPRDGEYDIICHHCSSSVDSLHQSVSDRNADSPRSPSSHPSHTNSYQPGIYLVPEATCEPPSLDSKVLDPKAALASGVPLPIIGHPPIAATLQHPYYGSYSLNIPNIPGLTFSISQKASNVVNPSSPVSDCLPKEPPKTPALSPLKSNKEGGPDDIASIPDLPPLPPPARPLEREDRPTTPAPGAPSRHPISPGTQSRISQAIAASLCSVEVENENRPPVGSTKGHCSRRMSLGQASNSSIFRNIATSIVSASHANESLASPVSLSAAVERFKEGLKKLSRMSILCQSVAGSSHPSKSRPLSRASSRTKRARAAAQRRRDRTKRRRERRKEKLEALATQTPKAERHQRGKQPPHEDENDIVVVSKPEQVNSATKRRDRREKMLHGRKDHGDHSRHVHMMTASSARPSVSCR
ncbi:hypothetical protein N7532_001837 [Penicillium argentinense]|uniref:Uncharacterized protein n=1 Tax=Penicillium argentinense TaxID=1131581 RepID=A0A9W9KMV9_9EURO|nr:uncharacterized protein N7532_001837 [Penicillium argentinense]KAJ5111302.1 hypothetical protein N7532_001837 [Penicillium argentinense]